MNRHLFILLTILFASAFLRDASAADATKPNILLLIVDDLNTFLLGDTNCYTGKVIALSIGSGSGEYGDPGELYAIDLHDESIRQKDRQPMPYELLRQLCMNDAPKEELYDLDADPWAVKNLVNDPARAETLKRMREQMTQWRTFTKDDDKPFAMPRGGATE